MAADTHKRRNCSDDLAEVPADAYIVADQGGRMYFCNARCLSIWALDFATKPNRPEEQKSIALDLTSPGGEREQFLNVHDLARWAVAHALGGG